jgi:hypothetical protein
MVEEPSHVKQLSLNHLCTIGLNETCRLYTFVVNRLKVPKSEIFDRSDFHDFYSIKSLLGGGGQLWS